MCPSAVIWIALLCQTEEYIVTDQIVKLFLQIIEKDKNSSMRVNLNINSILEFHYCSFTEISKLVLIWVEQSGNISIA